MNAAIVATDVVSMLFKGDIRALAYRPHITGRLLGISRRGSSSCQSAANRAPNGAEIAAGAFHDPVRLITNNRGGYSVVDGLALLSA